MKIPNKAYAVSYEQGVLYYLARKYSKYEQTLKELQLPQWLKDLIHDENIKSFEEGRENIRASLKEILKIE